ncbi:MAG: hypothetical protein QI223_03695 [Candidatus Korarchaeota archaeon]|nr:hypothetical protein [Candidatus Korarchaeota archaeon]
MSLAILSLFEAVRTVELAGERVDREVLRRAIEAAAKVYWSGVPPDIREGMRASFEVLARAITSAEITMEEEEVAIFAARELLEAERSFGIDIPAVIEAIDRELRSAGLGGLADLTMLLLSAKLRT